MIKTLFLLVYFNHLKKDVLVTNNFLLTTYSSWILK